MTGVSEKHEEIKAAAEALFAAKPEWIVFYREILGLRGMIRRHFQTPSSMTEFEQTDIYRQIQRMLAELRKLPPPKKDPASFEAAENGEAKAKDEDTRVITVRIPQSLHDALRIEAYEHRTSINKLCISKLLQSIDSEHVPAAFEQKKEEANL